MWSPGDGHDGHIKGCGSPTSLMFLFWFKCGIHCKAKGGVGRKNCSLGSSVSRGADPRRAPRPDPRAGPRPDPRPKISGPLGPEIFGRGSGRGPARGSGRGARRGSALRLTLLPWLQFFLPTPTFALQCFRLISTIQLLHISGAPVLGAQFLEHYFK